MIRMKTLTRPIPGLRRLVAVWRLAALTLFAPNPARAGRLGADVIALVPEGTSANSPTPT